LRKLLLKVDVTQAPPDILANLRQCLQPATAAGTFPIAIDYRNAEAQSELRLAGSWTLPLDDAGLQDLRQMLGKENVSLVF
jgi:DNA polymerase-3 subunit alpha